MPPVSYSELSSLAPGEPSEAIRRRVVAARIHQQTRFADSGQVHCNADMGARELTRHLELEPGARELLKSAMTTLHLSPRAYDRILEVARTIADLDNASPAIQPHHISEAIQYRSLDRQRQG